MNRKLKLAAASTAMAATVMTACAPPPSGSAPTPSESVAHATVRPSPGPTGTVSAAPRPAPRLAAERAAWRLPTALSREVVISAHGSGVLAGGLMAGDVSSDTVYQVTAARGIGSRLPSLTEPVHDAAGTQVGNRLIILGGGSSSELSAVESTTGDRRHWRIQGHLPSPRSDLSVAATSDGLLVIGGYDGLRSPRDVLVSADGRSFSTFARLRRGVRYAAVILVGDSAWVLGGEDHGGELQTTQIIDLKTGQVRLGHQLPTPLGHAAVALVGARILLMGGRTGPHRVTAKMWWFDPSSGQYSSAGKLPYPVADAGVLPSVDGVYLLGGESPAFTDRVIRVHLS